MTRQEIFADPKSLILPRSGYTIKDRRIVNFISDIIRRPKIELVIKNFRASYLNKSAQQTKLKAATSHLVTLTIKQEWPTRGPISTDEKDRLLDLLLLSPSLHILGLRRTHVSLGFVISLKNKARSFH
jgi:hypothetical protein